MILWCLQTRLTVGLSTPPADDEFGLHQFVSPRVAPMFNNSMKAYRRVPKRTRLGAGYRAQTRMKPVAALDDVENGTPNASHNPHWQISSSTHDYSGRNSPQLALLNSIPQ